MLHTLQGVHLGAIQAYETRYYGSRNVNLASWIPNDQNAFIGNIPLTSNFVAISGTSMACPHASDIAALLKGVEWSLAAIRSAMLTTANPFDNAHDYIKDSFFTTKSLLL